MLQASAKGKGKGKGGKDKGVKRGTPSETAESQDSKRLRCTYCGKPGHVAEKCFKKQRDEKSK